MTRDDPSPLRFLLARLDEEEERIIRNTPFRVAADEVDADFAHRYLSRGALMQRTQLDREIVSACIASMSRVQGPPPVPVPEGTPDETTVLGSDVLKRLAARFAWHPDYQPHWRP